MAKERLRTDSEISTAPMADLAFQLLIFFMISATFLVSRGLDFTIPEEGPVTFDPVRAVHLHIQTDGSLLADGHPLAISEVLSYIGPKLARNPNKPVILQTAPKADYGAMVEVYDQLRQGKDRLGLSREIEVAIPTRREIDQLWN